MYLHCKVVELVSFCSTVALTGHFACELHQVGRGREAEFNEMLRAVVGCGVPWLVRASVM